MRLSAAQPGWSAHDGPDAGAGVGMLSPSIVCALEMVIVSKSAVMTKLAFQSFQILSADLTSTDASYVPSASVIDCELSRRLEGVSADRAWERAHGHSPGSFERGGAQRVALEHDVEDAAVRGGRVVEVERHALHRSVGRS